MAYLTEYLRTCEDCARRTARYELHNQRNALMGYYCGPCGRRAEKRLQAVEDEAHARAATDPIRTTLPLDPKDTP